MYAGSGEFMPDEDSAFSIRKITARGCERVARAAFELARGRRGKVTAVHKANVLKLSDGLFLREVRKVAAGVPRRQARRADRGRRRRGADPRPGRLRRDRDHQHVRRHPVRRGLRALGQPRPRRLDQRRPRHLRRPGAARFRAGHRGPGRGQPDVAHPLRGDAARLAWPARRERRHDRGGGPHRLAPWTGCSTTPRPAPATSAAASAPPSSPPVWSPACGTGSRPPPAGTETPRAARRKDHA